MMRGPAALMILILLATTAYAQARGEVPGMPNPAAVYCESLGYEYVVEETPQGAAGHCLVDNDGKKEKYDEWGFFKGKVGKEHSYCAKKGWGAERKVTKEGSYEYDELYCVPKGGGKAKRMLDVMADDGKKLLPDVANGNAKTLQPDGEPVSLPVRGDAPSAFDWRDIDGKSYVSPIENQGSCGSCYAFGASAAAEGAYNWPNGRYNSSTLDLSESFIMWCLSRQDSYSSHFWGCSGASYYYQEIDAIVVYGMINESDFAYVTSDPGCTHMSDPRVTYSAWGRTDTLNHSQMQQSLMDYGVIDVAVNALSAFTGYSGGIYSDAQTTCPSGYLTTTNHAVALVGWGTDPSTGLYWILRNSWGTGWGEDGYMRIDGDSAHVTCAPTYLDVGYTTTTSTTSSTTMSSTTSTTLAPVLSGGTVAPSVGSETDIFNFTVTYTHAVDTAPTSMQVNIDGSGYDMQGTGSTYDSGVLYYYNSTLSDGTHSYFFYASDGSETDQTSAVRNPHVWAASPVCDGIDPEGAADWNVNSDTNCSGTSILPTNTDYGTLSISSGNVLELTDSNVYLNHTLFTLDGVLDLSSSGFYFIR